MWLICLLGCKAVSARERQIPNSKLHPKVSYTGTLIIVEELHGKTGFLSVMSQEGPTSIFSSHF